VSRVEINGAGHQVVIDHDGHDLAYVVEKAQKLWETTQGEQPPPGSAYGFSTERDRGLNVSTNKRWGGEIDPVRA
jgi:hypothetical protein